MSTVADGRISAQGVDLGDGVGALRRSDDVVGDAAELQRRLAADGYLFLPGYLARDEVLAARHDLLARLARQGRCEPGSGADDAIAAPGFDGFVPDVAAHSAPLLDLLYTGRMIELYEAIFGEAVRHFDYTWLRAVPPRSGTPPHMDSVFMNRGTLDLLTAWTPLGDIDRTLGGLAILERSHTHDDLRAGYGSRDVDEFCSNGASAEHDASHEGLLWNGALTDDPGQLRERLGGRWLTADFRAGDLLTFTLFTVHCGLDNNTDRLRLSCDSRYQRASQPADPRWIGAHPTAHGARSKRGVIC
jgi:hypothetical protein